MVISFEMLYYFQCQLEQRAIHLHYIDQYICNIEILKIIVL